METTEKQQALHLEKTFKYFTCYLEINWKTAHLIDCIANLSQHLPAQS